MTRSLTTRPNLDHLRGQAKTLLTRLRAGEKDAAQEFIDHLPKARTLTVAGVYRAGFRLADAQSVVARRSGFDSWAALMRHVEQLRALEGRWTFESLEIDGSTVQKAMIASSTLLLDGDLFRMESPEANYDGRFTINASVTPMHIDIQFVEGPDAGNSSYGIFEHAGDRLSLCLGLVGSTRPTTFATSPGSGHAFEILRRASSQRPAGVTGGTPVAVVAEQEGALTANPDDFASASHPMFQRLAGAWQPVRLVTNGEEMRSDWLSFGSRTSNGNEAKVVFGGQTMLHSKMRIDATQSPIAVDYLHLRGAHRGKVGLGIMEWIGDEVRFLMAEPGLPRPANFEMLGARLTLSQWRRKDGPA